MFNETAELLTRFITAKNVNVLTPPKRAILVQEFLPQSQPQVGKMEIYLFIAYY